MDKTTKQIIIAAAAVILIVAVAVLVYKSMDFGFDNSEKEMIDTLEVTYWDPWDSSMGNISYPAYSLSDYVNGSALIVSATVTETNENGNGKDCYLKVDDVLKGNFEINRIHLRTDVKTPAFTENETYVLFIAKSEQSGNYYYQLFGTEGYLLKTDSGYTGRIGNVTEKELTSAIKKSK